MNWSTSPAPTSARSSDRAFRLRDTFALKTVVGWDDVQVKDPGRLRRPEVTTVEIVGGPEALELELHRHDDRWSGIYLEHRQRIRNALAASDIEIEHIGSTSVPGLAAKPIVDIVVAVEDITAETDYLDPLIAAGYELRVREPGHRLVRTPARDVHVHLYERGAPAIGEYLLLRDRLRSDADDRALYESTKRALLGTRWDDMNDYADAKTDVIVAIKVRARAARGT
jgi:GrpB-like predicted nucleotidyltransferase (UPF0157 family)